MRPFRLSSGSVAVLFACAAAQAQTPCMGGQAAGYPCSGVDLLGHLPKNTFATPGSPAPQRNNDIWGWTDPETAREYALVGTTNGLAFVDVTAPAAPRFLGKVPATTVESVWRDVKVYRDHAFIVADGAGEHGMQVFDLARLRTLTGAPQTLAPDLVYNGAPGNRPNSTHNIALNEATGFAYLVGSDDCAGGLHMVDVREPQSPAFAGCFSADGYTHDTQCVLYDGPDTDYAGREICFSSNQDAVAITDVTDKGAPALITAVAYPSFGYTHQGWLTDDRRFFLVDDELDEFNALVDRTRTLVLDVEDLDNAAFAFAYLGPVNTADHNLYVRGQYAYLSNYESGLRVLDLAGIEGGTLVEAGFFDTYPSGNNVSFNGQWSNYPYFASGNVVANDRDTGLFVLRFEGLGVAGEPAPEAAGYTLGAAAPNPFSGRTEFVLAVGRAQTVRAEAFDALGRRVAVFHDGPLAAGARQRLVFDGGGLPPGVYLVRVTGETFAETRRAMLVR